MTSTHPSIQIGLIDNLLLHWRGCLLSACFLLLLLSGHTLAYGNTSSAIGEDAIGSGELHLHTPQGEQLALLKNTDIQVVVNGMIARVIVKQEFENTSQAWIEGEYVFPLASNSAVDYMAMHIGKRKIVGKIREKQHAKQLYEQAKQAGKKASLVVQQRPNLFTNRIANIGPGETIIVELHYVETPQYDQGRFSLRIPTTLTPRYIPGQAFAKTAASNLANDEHQNDFTNSFNSDGKTTSASQPTEIQNEIVGSGWHLGTNQVPDAAHITPPMKPTSQAAPLTLQATINSGIPLASVNSLYHAMEQHSVNNVQQLTLQPGARLDRDVVLEWSPQTGNAPLAAVFRETINNQHYLLLMVMPPQDFSSAHIFPRETIFVIDTSGSMAGDAIRQAKAALQNGLDKLKPTDRFNIIEFNSNARALWPNAVAAAGHQVQLGKQFVQRLNADGGTEMSSALQLALRHDAPEGYIRQVIFITDGSVGNEAALFSQIRASRGNSRVFTVGIGAAPNSFFMQNAAEAGQGSYTYIGTQTDIARVMSDLFYKLENPVLTNITADLGNATLESYPAKLPDLYAGEPIIIAARTDTLPAYITLRGVRADQAFEQQLDLTQQANASDISKLWARRKLHELYNQERLLRSQNYTAQQNGDQDAVKQSITQLALDHQLMSTYTSFVAIEEKISRPTNSALEKHLEANAMPKGNTMAIPIPQGGLGLNALWATALFALLALFALHFSTHVRQQCVRLSGAHRHATQP